MLSTILAIVIGVVTFFAALLYIRFREEAKRDGFVSDEYIENNEEDDNNDRA